MTLCCSLTVVSMTTILSVLGGHMTKSKSTPVDIHGHTYHRGLMLTVILIAAFAGGLMQTSLSTAIPTLMDKFDISLSTAQQASTWFSLASGIMVPLSAFLVNRFPVKWLHIAGYSLLIIGVGLTYATPESNDMWWLFVAGRIIAAIAFGVILPLMQMVILNIYDKSEQGLAMGLAGLVVGMSPAIGPTLTGWILDKSHTILGITISSSWRTMFVIPLIIFVIALALSPFLIKDVLPTKHVKLDVLSLAQSSIGFGLFLIGFTNVAGDGWSDWKNVILPIVGGVLLIGWFVVRQLHLKQPFLDVRVFKSANFSYTTLAVVLVTMAMYGVEMVLPTYLQNVHGLTPLSSGLTLLPGALLMGFMSPIAGIIYNKVGVKPLALVGFSLLGIGTIPFVFLTASTSSAVITIMYTLRMVGVGLTLMPLTTAAMAALPVSQATDGTAANNTARQISSSVVVAILTSVVQNVTSSHMPTHAAKLANPLRYALNAVNASMSGFQIAFIVGLVFAIIGVIAVAFMKSKQEVVK